jgi:hypothetical protein
MIGMFFASLADLYAGRHTADHATRHIANFDRTFARL